MEKKIYKVYQIKHTFMRYTACVVVDGKSIDCPFTGGVTAPVWTGGTFATEDVNVQAALEARNDFNNLIVLAHSSETISDKKDPIAVINEQIEEAMTPAPEAEKKIIAGVKNSQEAKKWLSENIEGVTYAQMPNRDAVNEVASKHNIEFVDWVQK